MNGCDLTAALIRLALYTDIREWSDEWAPPSLGVDTE